MPMPLETTSKFISLVLRHKPETIGLCLDAEGWANIDELLAQSRIHGNALTRAQLEEVVATSDKKRFVIDPQGLKIRANQGHTLAVDLKLVPLVPPEVLYHGTATRFVSAIRAQGLLPGSRQHVHLSLTRDAAMEVGKRHGKPVVLGVHAEALHQSGHAFYLSANGIWLTANVPAPFLEFGELPGFCA